MEHIADYIQKQSSQREAGLIIADEAQAQHVEDRLRRHHYHEAASLDELVRQMGEDHPVYWHYSEGDFQLLYSFIAQYAGGMIELFEPHTGVTHRASSVAPGFVLVVSKERLEQLEAQGYAVRQRVGLAFQV